jgi:hypothetical protein
MPPGLSAFDAYDLAQRLTGTHSLPLSMSGLHLYAESRRDRRQPESLHLGTADLFLCLFPAAPPGRNPGVDVDRSEFVEAALLRPVPCFLQPVRGRDAVRM